ncbi:C40 family peptidase [Anaeroselena agilis]|uniref:NlpC/P60 family protein n=1 Tax=Anaeroselena agilis TaxID=3063788 RepID=A0ABU3NYL2_9FIRM|nr:NlpC/P60 family protein [Selenomonadales bacterium 4137-cl]
MRIFRRCLVLCCLFLSVTTVAFAAATFEEGDWGPDVAQIQTTLGTLGYDAGPADGEFGSATKAAVKAFQKDRGLDADGVVGPATYRAMMGRDIPVSRDGASAATRKIIQAALRYLGVPYVFGGNTPDGFDCSGFTRYVFARGGFGLPRMADEQYALGRSVSKAQLRPGDLVFFTTYTDGASHVGIYLGEGKFISATSSRGVAIDRMADSYWGPRYIGARRV